MRRFHGVAPSSLLEIISSLVLTQALDVMTLGTLSAPDNATPGPRRGERELIAERTRLRLAKTRADDKRLVRPLVPRPTAKKIRALRDGGYTWAEVRRRTWVIDLGSSPGSKEAVKRGAQNGRLKRDRRPTSEGV